jgi:hypothetical protein
VNGGNRVREQDGIDEKPDWKRDWGKLRDGELDAEQDRKNQDSDLYQPRQPLPIFQFRIHC